MSSGAMQVVVVGGGFAGIEVVLALRDLAPKEIDTTLVSAGTELVYRPDAVDALFGVAPRRYRLSKIAQATGCGLSVGRVVAVRTDERSVELASGRAFTYDELVVACGAAPEPVVEHATTLLASHTDDLHWIVREIEDGTAKDVVLVAGAHAGWTLPVYEIALRLAACAGSMCVSTTIVIATHEARPLGIIEGPGADAVARALADAGIEVLTGCREFHRRPHGLLTYPDGRTLPADRVIALPDLRGPAFRGLPRDERGFICVGPTFGVPGEPHVHAVGDAAAYPVKQGGLATQQADTAAEAIAARARGLVARQPFAAALRAVLMTGSSPSYLSGKVAGGRVQDAQLASDLPPWGRARVAGDRLTPFLANLDQIDPVAQPESGRWSS